MILKVEDREWQTYLWEQNGDPEVGRLIGLAADGAAVYYRAGCAPLGVYVGKGLIREKIRGTDHEFCLN